MAETTPVRQPADAPFAKEIYSDTPKLIYLKKGRRVVFPVLLIPLRASKHSIPYMEFTCF